ncbi:MAG TPA: cytochrome c-type biogenesis protein [Steroidobacteraceae bacterium]|nr:cytochrome c-type biogenesis protein [Steroidobacteraceae bacterium]
MTRELSRAAHQSHPPRLMALAACLVALGGLLFGSSAYAVDPTQLPDPKLQQRYLALTHELRCVQCQNEAIADSPAGIAADLRREVAEMLLAGKSDDDVRNFMLARYGDFVLFRPRFAPKTAWVWVTPGVLLLIGAFVSWRIVRARTALVPLDNEPLEEDLRG